MNKSEFNTLQIEEQISVINKFIETEGSLRKACEKLTVSRTTIRDRFKKIGYELCKNCNNYAFISEHKCNTEVVKTKKNTVKLEEHKGNTNVLMNDNIKNKFMWLMNNFDILEDIVNSRIQNEHKCNTSVVEVKSSEFVIDLPTSDAHHTTIRVNKVVWDEFNEIYNLKYKHLNKIDVLSVALKQFNDRNK